MEPRRSVSHVQSWMASARHTFVGRVESGHISSGWYYTVSRVMKANVTDPQSEYRRYCLWESLNTLSRATVTSWLRVASVRRGEVGNCMHVACTRIAVMNRPIACGSDIFLSLPLSAASPDGQSRRVAILICSIRSAGSTGVSGSVLITFASGAYIWPCGKIKIQVVSMECSPWRKDAFRRCIHLVYHHGSLCRGRSPTVG